MKIPFVWQMIQEAVNEIEAKKTTYPEIKSYVSNRWKGVNQKTVTAQIIVLTVNHPSRIHYPENKKPRKTNSGSPYDFLYRTERGTVEKYNTEKHGVWEINYNHIGELEVRSTHQNEIYSPSDILWFKNVSNSEVGEAYLDIDKNEFILDFPNRHKGNILSPSINEIILLYQKIDGTPSFTHLVTPIDNIIVDHNQRSKYRFGRKVKVIAKTERENTIPVSKTLWNKIGLAGITQGNACAIENISSITNTDLYQFDIWNKFLTYFTPENKKSVLITSSLMTEINNSDPELAVEEGGLKLVSHFVKERNQKIVREKKLQALNENKLNCEVCTFSFFEQYDANYIECHHIIPIGERGVRETTLKDLALVCANCHRMLHKIIDGAYLSIEELKQRMKRTMRDDSGCQR